MTAEQSQTGGEGGATTSKQSHVVGFVGLGTMGMGMASTLVKAGFRVQGYDLNPAAMRTFVDAGGTGVPSVAAAADGADALVIVVVNAEQAEEVLFGAGAAEALPPGSVVLLSSTVGPAFARHTASRLYALGREMLDAPVSGGMVKAADGSLTIMASGHPAAFEQAQPILAPLAAQVYRVGDECGQASTVKMVNQLLAGVHIAAAAEAMAFGVKAGVDPDVLYTIISNSAGASWMFQNRVPHMLAGDFTPLSAVEIFVKDLGIVLETGKETRFPLPLAAIAHQLFLAAAAAGLGHEDDAAVVKVFEQVAHISVRKQP
ncbi:MAG TPA: L-threonate dehydrogenase [Herpetosiphonaceae bacterium]|nr:L-threonate dehydrogenase [Herpetosiphonaceae bacterium]